MQLLAFVHNDWPQLFALLGRQVQLLCQPAQLT